MSTHGQFNSKNPTIKRILREAAELANSPSADYHAAPLESNLFEWHFTLRGPPTPSHFAGGIYHGRIVLPATYPLRPPSFRFLTPSGRFEPNREICLSISGHHEESWQPAWGIRTAIVAIRSFMDSEAKGQLGGIDADERSRRRLAETSRSWKCSGCGGRTNEEILKEREVGGGKSTVEEKVPEELRLGYRDEMQDSKQEHDAADGTKESDPARTQTTPSAGPKETAAQVAASPPTSRAASVVQNQLRQVQSHDPSRWLDIAIAGIALALFVLLLRKLLAWSS